MNDHLLKKYIDTIFLFFFVSMVMFINIVMVKLDTHTLRYLKGNRVTKNQNYRIELVDNTYIVTSLKGDVEKVDIDYKSRSIITNEIIKLLNGNAKEDPIPSLNLEINFDFGLASIYFLDPHYNRVFKINTKLPSYFKPKNLFDKLDYLYDPNVVFNNDVIKTLLYLGLNRHISYFTIYFYKNIITVYEKNYLILVFFYDIENLLDLKNSTQNALYQEAFNNKEEIIMIQFRNNNIRIYYKPFINAQAIFDISYPKHNEFLDPENLYLIRNELQSYLCLDTFKNISKQISNADIEKAKNYVFDKIYYALQKTSCIGYIRPTK